VAEGLEWPRNILGQPALPCFLGKALLWKHFCHLIVGTKKIRMSVWAGMIGRVLFLAFSWKMVKKVDEQLLAV